MKNWWSQQLREREDAHLLRTLRPIPPDALDLASNDYLGLARDPRIIEAACEAMREFGAGARAARLVSGETSLHRELEESLANFRNTETALLFPSGYHANLSAVTALAGKRDLVCCDKRNHASLIDACRLAGAQGAKVRYYDSLEKLSSLLDDNAFENRLIVSDAVYSMDGDIAPVPDIYELAMTHGATLILDDAHGTGTLGSQGRGALQFFQESGWQPDNLEALVLTGTLSKALGSQGGFVAGSRPLIDWLVNTARPFIYTTALNPASCGAALGALRVVEQEPQRVARLHEVKDKLAGSLGDMGYKVPVQPSPIIPVHLGEAKDAMHLSSRLQEAGIWCPAIRPPTVPQRTSRLRVTASATLTDEQLSQILDVFRSAQP